MSIHFQLPAVAFQLFPIGRVVHIRFFLGFEINQFYRLVFTNDQIDIAFEDVFILDQRDIHFSFLDPRPVLLIAVVISQDLLQGDVLDIGSQVNSLFFGQESIIGIEPGGHLLLRRVCSLHPGERLYEYLQSSGGPAYRTGSGWCGWAQILVHDRNGTARRSSRRGSGER